MSSFPYAADAPWAVAVLAAEDAYDAARADGARVLEAPLDPRLSDDWRLLGHLTAQDCVLRRPFLLGAERVWYGWLLSRRDDPGRYAAVIRGTAGAREWAEDCDAVPVTAVDGPGRVEAGFAGVYATFRYRTLDGREVPLAPALAEALGDGRVTVTGHSLGAALATMLGADVGAGILAPRAEVSARLFASPRPGTSEWIGWAATNLGDYAAYAAADDLVPRVPAGADYASLPGTVELTTPAGWKIDATAGAEHHLASYLLRLTGRLDAAWFRPIDRPYLDCLSRA